MSVCYKIRQALIDGLFATFGGELRDEEGDDD
jgi:hypothetical protein